jgi:hypothetical protein
MYILAPEDVLLAHGLLVEIKIADNHPVLAAQVETENYKNGTLKITQFHHFVNSLLSKQPQQDRKYSG